MSDLEVSLPLGLVVGDARLANYFAVSAFTVLFIDFASTIDEEINFVWKRPWSIPSGLYLWNRYMTWFTVLFTLPFMFQEVTSDHIQGLASTLLFGTFDLLLALRFIVKIEPWSPRLCLSRVWMLYDRTRRMAYILFPIIAVEMISMIGILVSPQTYLYDFVHLGPALTGCYYKTSVITGLQFAFYDIPPRLVTFVMFILTIYKCIITLRQDKLADQPIINLFLREGIVWFIVVFFLYGSELVIWATARPTLDQVLVLPSIALFSLISSRILLKTRSFLSPQTNMDDDPENEENPEHEQLLPPVGVRVGWRT
ncbi:hypothetical protein MSAN_00645800 [Mycena sanguinolenta]|uniref:DUF6533 domain-containing protein n=1 Tax=Mycena sanguinolenta TaxID=230812 RepID=A0A8H6Z000_9AGAR|nr:hypothetical protein MSAN_00645800 [Mycena sanguinolenta]